MSLCLYGISILPVIFFHVFLSACPPLIESLEALPRSYVSQLQTRDAITENEVDKFSPPAGDKDHFAVGLIESFGGFGKGAKGTGIILNMFKDSTGNLIAEGISALHNFLEIDKTFGFYGSSQLSMYFDNKPMGHINIESVRFELNDEKKPVQDICLFKGEVVLDIPLEEEITGKEAFYSSFQDLKPELQTTEEILDIKKKGASIDGYMLHYPLNILDCRLNKGTINIEENTHIMPSYRGSSGSPLFVETGDCSDYKILGIHTRYVNPDDEEYVKYTFKKEENSAKRASLKIRVVDKNSFIPLTQETYQALENSNVFPISKNIDSGIRSAIRAFYKQMNTK